MQRLPLSTRIFPIAGVEILVLRDRSSYRMEILVLLILLLSAAFDALGSEYYSPGPQATGYFEIENMEKIVVAAQAMDCS